MPTISKIPMSGYSPIANRKSNQKASNPMSTNNQNSASLNMSPNAHYGRHAVSFKAHTPLPFEDAKRFVTKFSLPHVSGNDLEWAVHVSTDKLLNIAKDHESLKEEALSHFSGLLNHGNDLVKSSAMSWTGEAIQKDHSLATPELLHNHIVPFLKKDQSAKAYHTGLSTLAKFAEVNPDALTPQILTPELVNKPIKTCLNNNDTLFSLLYKPQIFDKISAFTKINPEIFHNFIPEIKLGLKNEDARPALNTIQNSAKYIKPEIVPDLLDHVQPLTHYTDENTRNITFKTIGKLAEVNHSIVTPKLIQDDILPGLEHDHYHVKNEAINTIGICAQINPTIVTKDILDKVKQFTLLDRDISGVKKTAKRVYPELKTIIGSRQEAEGAARLQAQTETLPPLMNFNLKPIYPSQNK